jgi:hypothetical protein
MTLLWFICHIHWRGHDRGCQRRVVRGCCLRKSLQRTKFSNSAEKCGAGGGSKSRGVQTEQAVT